MAKVNAYVHHFSTGEVSRAALARVDHEKLRLAAEIQENILPHAIGKGLFRPATGYIAGTKDNNRARLIKFVKSVDDVAVLELSNALLRILLDDEFITRGAVTSSVTNGDFSASTGWSLTTTGDATADINSTVSGALYMACPNRGGTAFCERSVTTSSTGNEHALRITVTRGPVSFRCGSSSGADDYIRETTLDTGVHSLAFTPSGTYHVRFSTRREQAIIVDSIQVEAAGVLELPAPWTTAQLREIRHDQSADIVFLAHRAWQQRKIERRAARSWSLVKYQTDDGPFMTARSADVKLTPAQTYGNTTMSSDSAFFRPEHVGCLFRLFHDQTASMYVGLGAAGENTEAIRVNGVGSDNVFTVHRTGTYSATITLQRSYTSRTEGFVNTSQAISTVGSSNVDPGSSLDNVIHWYRAGLTAYTSGSVRVGFSYTGDARAGLCRVTAYNSSTSVDIEVLSPFGASVATSNWLEGEWSDLSGWPSIVGFYDGRLWWGRDDRFWASISDNYYSFTLDEEMNPLAAGDAGSIQRNIATGGSVNSVQWFLSLQRPVFGTTGAESSARASSFDEPITPSNIGVKDASTQGSAPVSPVKVDGRGLFVQRSGRKVFQIMYSFENNDYVSRDLTALNDEIGGDGIVELDVQRQPETYAWFVRNDGQVAVLGYDLGENITGWVRFITDGEVESVCTVPGDEQDSVYLVVKRTINGNDVRYIEKLGMHSEAIGGEITKLGDAGILTEGPVSTVVAAHLANETGLVGWGTRDGAQYVLTGLSADGSGNIALGNTYTNVWVGLPYTGRYKSAKLAYGAQKGTAIMMRKKVEGLGILLENTHRDALKIGSSFSKLYNFLLKSDAGQPLSDGEAVKSVHDDVAQPFSGDWNTDSRVHLTIQPGHPATLLGLLVPVDTNE
jgi:hypothetical protein